MSVPQFRPQALSDTTGLPATIRYVGQRLREAAATFSALIGVTSGVTAYTFEAFGAVGDGRDDYAAMIAAARAAPVGSTITGTPGKVYGVSQPFNPGAGKHVDLQGSTIKALAVMSDVCATTNANDATWEHGTIDANQLASSGLTSYALTQTVSGFETRRITVTNLPPDHLLVQAGIRCVSNTPYRHIAPKAIDTTLTNTGGIGVMLIDGDGAEIDTITGTDVENHLSEFDGCTMFRGAHYRGTRNGGSVAACGVASGDGMLEDIMGDGAEGDATTAVETNSARVQVIGQHSINSWKTGVSCNFSGSYPYPNDTNRSNTISQGYVRAAAAVSITGATQSNPCELTVPSHGIKTIYLSNTVQVSISGVVGMTQLNGLTPTVTSINPSTGVHDPDHLWLSGTGSDSSAYTTYTSGGIIAPFAAGANLYGSTPPQMDSIVIDTWEAVDYNVLLTMLYGNNCQARNIFGSRLQGVLSAVARFTYQTRFKVSGLRYGDASNPPSDPLGAVQLLTDPGNAVNICDGVELFDIFVDTCPGPVLYLEGNGTYTIDGLTTNSAAYFISIKAGASPTIHLRNFSGTVTTAPFLIGVGAAPIWDIAYEQRTRIVTAPDTATFRDGLLLVDTSGFGPITETLPSAASVPGLVLTIKKTDAIANAVTVGGTVDGVVNPTLAAQYKSMTVKSDGTNWNKIASV